jgi:hypothetical protein
MTFSLVLTFPFARTLAFGEKFLNFNLYNVFECLFSAFRWTVFGVRVKLAVAALGELCSSALPLRLMLKNRLSQNFSLSERVERVLLNSSPRH